MDVFVYLEYTFTVYNALSLEIMYRPRLAVSVISYQLQNGIQFCANTELLFNNIAVIVLMHLALIK